VIAVGPSSMRRVESIMGTTVSIDIKPPLVEPVILDEVVEQLRDVDARFSPYRDDSGTVAINEIVQAVNNALAGCPL